MRTTAGAQVLAVVAFLSAPACRSRAPDGDAHADPQPSAVAAKPRIIAEIAHVDIAPASEDALQVILDKTDLMVDTKKVVPLPAPDDAARDGFGAAVKSKATSLGPITPLAEAIARHDYAGFVKDEAIVAAYPETPYRLIAEVVFTLLTSRVSRIHMMRLMGTETPSERTAEEIPAAAMHDGDELLKLTLTIGPDGIAFQTASGTIGSGCKLGATGPAAPRIGGKIDLDALRHCAQQQKANHAEENQVSIGAMGAIPYGEIFEAMDAVRDDGHVKMFSDVLLLAP